jgi:septal ring factor EnvC (AmiA/AmiB activator)
MQYLKQYSRVQKTQAEEIKEKNAELMQKKKDVEVAKVERNKTLMDIRNEQSKLIAEEQNRKNEMSEAEGKQKELKKVLQDKQNQANRLNAEIERLIAEEVARIERETKRLEEERRKKRDEQQRIAEEKRRKELKGKTKKEIEKQIEKEKESIPEVVKEEPLIAEAEIFNLSKNFVANKGRLPMPVTGAASIVSSFGVQKHSEWNVSTNNSGIDIQAQQNSDIRSIFEGEVSRIIAFPGYNNCVILRHGEYYTFYANIINVYVKKGQMVKTGEALGKIYTDSDTGIATMHFQLWKKTTKLDPGPWLSR